MSIRLSKEHGVAPALTFCRICGKEAQEIALLGASCNKVMKDLYQATDGQHGSEDGYKEYGHNRIPAQEPCDECLEYLNGGIIFISKDTEEYLRLDKAQVDTLVGRIVDAKNRVLDFDAIRGKVCTIDRAWWKSDGENIRLRDPKEWTTY